MPLSLTSIPQLVTKVSFLLYLLGLDSLPHSQGIKPMLSCKFILRTQFKLFFQRSVLVWHQK